MRTNLNKSILAALCLFCLLVLSACGGGGGGTADTDGDGIADSADNCPAIANANQADSDGDGIGNVCETVVADADGDGVADSIDNCPATANSNQADTDGDKIGNVCDPTPLADLFNWTGNTRLTTIATNGLLANDLPGSVITAVNTATTLGTVNVNQTTGAFTYDPPVGEPATGFSSASDTFTYTVAGETATVTINLAERIWYVNNTATGADLGTDQAPFKTLVQAQNNSDVNDTIFVFTGLPLAPTVTGQDRGIVLKAGQKLIGQGIGLKFNGVPLVNALANNPLISNATLPNAAALNLPVVMLATGNEVAGLTINATFNEGILAVGGSGHNLHDNTINVTAGTGREGIRLLSITGSNYLTSNTITGAQRDGIKLVNNENQAGNLVVATPVVATVTMSRNTISNSAQDGIAVILDGATTAVTLNILTNTISGSTANEGINIDSLGAAAITSVLSRNTIANSTQEAIDLGAVGSMKAFVANNNLSVSGLTDFRAANTNASGNICLELINNSNATATVAGNSTFQVDNGVGGTFSFFERANDALAIRAPNNMLNIVEGGCNIPLNGAALFVANCAACHSGKGIARLVKNDLIARDITGRTAAIINAQFNPPGTLPAGNLSMVGVFVRNGRLMLTQQEITAIAAALAP